MASIRTLHRRVRPRSAGGEDRLSALPDELIHLILSRLDTRTALSTAVLPRRWARLPRWLPALDFRVSDILPPQYHRALALSRRDPGHVTASDGELDALMACCELRAMRAFVNGIARILETDGGVDVGGHGGSDGRYAKTLRLEFFPMRDAGCIDRLITAAVGTWGVEDLEVVVRPAPCRHGAPAYSFPHDCLDNGGRSRLRSLTLGNCTLPPLRRYGALTTLVLQDMAVDDRVFEDCTLVQVLRLKSCRCAENCLVVDAPCSTIRELIVEDCSFVKIELRAVPMLVRLACLTNSMQLEFGSVPSLTHVNLTFSFDNDHIKLRDFLGNSPTMTNLVIRFTGPRTWIMPEYLDEPLHDLKRLLVADVPSNWDVSWPRYLLIAAPSLEVLHIHVAHSEEKRWHEIMWKKSKRWHRHLKELVMIGFRQTLRQIQFVRYIVRVCRSLQRVVLLKDGHVRYKGLWDWELVRQPECQWSDVDKMVVRRMVKSGRCWSRPRVEVVLG